MKKRIIKIAVVVLVGLAIPAYWSTGRMDLALANLGFNYTDCAQNGFGAMLCGDDLKAWQKEAKKEEADQARAEQTAQDQYESDYAKWQKCAAKWYGDYITEQCGSKP